MAKLRADRRINLIESFDNVLANQRKRILFNFHLNELTGWLPLGTLSDPDVDRAKTRHREMTLGPALHRSEDIEVEIKRAWTGQIIR
jgi:hypothetical protein